MKWVINMNLENRKNVLVEVGKTFYDVCQNINNHSFPGFENIYHHNLWFSERNVKFALREWSNQLNQKSIDKWLSEYKIPDNSNNDIKLGLITAGNIPLVGLHDFICGYITGVKLRLKLSSKDKVLMNWVIDIIKSLDPDFENKIIIFDERLKDFNAIIATGSNNTNRYFEYYFKNYPKILRRNRNSIAILDGNESKDDLEMLADDIFIYFGLGCRNISNIFVPKDYKFDLMAEAFSKYNHVLDNNKYANNFNYQYTLIAMNRTLHINLNNCLLVENQLLHSPVAVINYQYYSDINSLNSLIKSVNSEIQCIVSKNNNLIGAIALGESQKPTLSDYADNIDTMKFLLNLQ
jgi:hypothetical protein